MVLIVWLICLYLQWSIGRMIKNDQGKVSPIFYTLEILIYLLLIIPTIFLTYYWWKYYWFPIREFIGFAIILTASWILYTFIRIMSKSHRD